MIKKICTVIALLSMTMVSNAQRLHLVDVISLYDFIMKDPVNFEVNVNRKIKESGPGWSDAIVKHGEQMSATWKYHVGQGTYGTLRFIIQKLDGETVPKVAYECPYISACDDFTADLKKYGAELQDSYNDTDGGLVTVYILKGYTYILARFPLEVSHNTVDGKPSPYFKMLMHPTL